MKKAKKAKKASNRQLLREWSEKVRARDGFKCQV